MCSMHNEKYKSYCNKCKKDICLVCENDHKGHELIYYDKLIIEESQIIKSMAEIKKK